MVKIAPGSAARTSGLFGIGPTSRPPCAPRAQRPGKQRTVGKKSTGDGRLRQPVPTLAKAAPRYAGCQWVRPRPLVNDGGTERTSILKNGAQASRQMG